MDFASELRETADRVNSDKAEKVAEYYVSMIKTECMEAASKGEYETHLSPRKYPEIYGTLSAKLYIHVRKKVGEKLTELGITLLYREPEPYSAGAYFASFKGK